MKNPIKMLRDCEGCKRRRDKVVKLARVVDKSARDMLRRRRKK